MEAVNEGHGGSRSMKYSVASKFKYSQILTLKSNLQLFGAITLVECMGLASA